MKKLGFGVVLAMCLSIMPGPVNAAYPGTSGKIVFSSDTDDDGRVDINVADNDGANPSRLTHSPGADLSPRFSPGGAFIAFTRYSTSEILNPSGLGPGYGPSHIWVMRSDGSDLRQLTVGSFNDFAPSWSPDGSRIAFGSNRSSATSYDIWILDLDTGKLSQLTKTTGSEYEPTWSPDGGRIAFVASPFAHGLGNQRLQSRRIDGADLKTHYDPGTVCAYQVFPNQWIGVQYPDWSPDGLQIAFTLACFNQFTGQEAGWIARVVLATGLTNQNPPGPDSFWFLAPRWSPDGASVLFQREEVGWVPETHNAVADAGTLGPPLKLTEDFRDQYTPDWQTIPGFALVDARFSPFEQDIQWVYEEGITVGCTVERYCPDRGVTRGQMASFLVRALGLPVTAVDYFSDDNGTTHEKDINRLAAAGITSGCGGTTYCPNATVTRGQMASFLVRALGLPVTAVDYFSDDNGTTHEKDINRLAAAGITSGCGGTNYCPNATVTRGQMAAFLRRALVD